MTARWRPEAAILALGLAAPPAVAMAAAPAVGTAAVWAQDDAAPAPEADPYDPAIYPSPEETRAEFAGVCTRFQEGDNPYFGRRVVSRLERALAASGRDEPSRLLIRLRLAHELIRLGRHQEALDLLEANLARLDEVDVPDEASLRLRHLRYLGIAHLQLAEDQNCLENHRATSCILPFTQEAVHRRPEHARRAGDAFQALLESGGPDPQSRWLLNLARALTGEGPDAVPEALRLPAGLLTPPGPGGFPWRDVGAEVGVDSFDLAGGGVVDDFDGDGLLDVISSSWDPCESAKAFRNTGHGDFEDVSDAWGLSAQLGGLNLVQGDFDGDGALDLLVLRGAWRGDDGRIRNSLLRNDLHRPAGRFVDVTAAAGLAYPAYPTQTAAWADYDRDGDLDLYVGNEATTQSVDPLNLFGRTGNAFPSQLFRNEGDGTFTDVARTAGVTNLRYAKGVAWGDYDDDGWPDLYVSNIGANRLYHNEGAGPDGVHFTDVARELGVDEPVDGSFPTWFFDFDNDGDLDLFVAGYSARVARVSASYLGEDVPEGHPVLYRNDGGRFTDVSSEMGFTRPLLVMGANYGDFDADGWPDLYLGTGVPDFDALMPNAAYRNDRGRRFEDVTFTSGLGHLQKGHAVAFGDVDNDGQQELFEQLGGAFPYDGYHDALYDHEPLGHHWITLRLTATGANRFAFGARVEVRLREAGEVRSVHTVVGATGSFGGSSLQQEIGLGDASAIELVRILWPGPADGGDRVQEFREVGLDRIYDAVEGEPTLRPVRLPEIALRRPRGAAEERLHPPNPNPPNREP